MISQARVKLIHWLIDLNERIIFYPKLKKCYLKHLKVKAPLIIDVGCNHGQSIDFFLNLDKNSAFIGFEPNKMLYEKLKVKYATNNNISIHNKGISNMEGELMFQENILDLTSTFESVDTGSSYLKMKAAVLGVKPENLILRKYKIPVVSLSGFFIENNIQHVDVLKIDVEGHELQCLQGLFSTGAKIPYIDYIQYEMHMDDMYSNQNEDRIAELLNNNNFREIEKVKHGFGNFYEMIYKNQSIRNEA